MFVVFLFLRLLAIQVLIYQGFISAEKEKERKKKKPFFRESLHDNAENKYTFLCNSKNEHPLEAIFWFKITAKQEKKNRFIQDVDYIKVGNNKSRVVNVPTKCIKDKICKYANWRFVF